ncbi:MAG: sigma-70 family RNA polymerase sigma factor [Pseudomonadota bacterium]
MREPGAAYGAFETTLRRYLSRRLPNPDDVEDVLQDVFLRVTRNRGALETAERPLAWLHTVAKSSMLDHLRRQARQARVKAALVAESAAEPAADPESGDFAQCLRPLIDSLSDPYREAIRYVDIEGGRQVDLARQTDVTVSTIKSRVQRGRRQLKTAILACCLIERDGRNAIAALAPGSCGEDCCT